MSWRGRMLEAAFAVGVLGSVFAWGGGREDAALEATAWEERGTASVREAERTWSLEAPEHARHEPLETGAGAAALRRLGDEAAGDPGRLEPGPPGSEPRELEPDLAARLEDELRLTEDAIEASRRRSEASLAEAREASRLARVRPDASGGAGFPVPALACGGVGSACLSSAACCSGLACAGGVPGFGTRGRCEPPR